jgi:hypothetical protein
MDALSQYTRTVGAGKTFLSPSDLFIKCDTSGSGAVIIVPPKISTIMEYLERTGGIFYSGFRFYDIGNNASVNNIIIECMDDDLVDGVTSITLNQNGIGGVMNFVNINNWLLILNNGNQVSRKFTSGQISVGGGLPVTVVHNLNNSAPIAQVKQVLDGSVMSLRIDNFTNNSFDVTKNGSNINVIITANG